MFSVNKLILLFCIWTWRAMGTKWSSCVPQPNTTSLISHTKMLWGSQKLYAFHSESLKGYRDTEWDLVRERVRIQHVSQYRDHMHREEEEAYHSCNSAIYISQGLTTLTGPSRKIITVDINRELYSFRLLSPWQPFNETRLIFHQAPRTFTNVRLVGFCIVF